MKVNFKFLVFCLIGVFLIASYELSIEARKKRDRDRAPSREKRAPRRDRRAYSRGRRAPRRGRVSVTREAPTIIYVTENMSIPVPTPGDITAPRAGLSYSIQDLFDLINTNNPAKSSNFIITVDGISSYGADRYGFTKTWAENNTTSVTLKQDIAQVQRLINRGVLPGPSHLAELAEETSLAKRNLYTLLSYVYNNFPKIMLYFEAVSPTDGQTYRLYITDPCPGEIRPAGNVYSIPAYTNVLSKWNVE